MNHYIAIADMLAVLTASERALVLRMVDDKASAAPYIVTLATDTDRGASTLSVVRAIRECRAGLDIVEAKAACDNGRMPEAMALDDATEVADRINAAWILRVGTGKAGDWRPASVVDVRG